MMNSVFKTRNPLFKTRSFVLNMMNFAALAFVFYLWLIGIVNQNRWRKGSELDQVSFQFSLNGTNPDALLKNPDLLLKNHDYLMKIIEFII